MFQRFNQISFAILLLILIVVPVISQDTVAPTPTLSPSPSPSPTASMTASPTFTAELTPEVTPEASATPLPSATPIPTQAEVTAEISPEITEISTEASSTESVIAPETTELVEETEVVAATEAVEVTEAVTEVVTQAVGTVTATPGGFVLQVIRGQVIYQNRAEQEGISVAVLSLDGVLLSLTETNSRGVFSLAAPAEVGFVLLIEAPLHRSLRINMNPDDELPRLVLAGGDLNGDSCINQADMDVLLLNYEKNDTPASDVNADGTTDLSDLAILTGNYDANCGIVVESTEEAQ